MDENKFDRKDFGMKFERIKKQKTAKVKIGGCGG